MARKRPDPEIVLSVSYVTDPEQARAAQQILREGFRRAMVKVLHEQAQKAEGRG